jgi:hypothetical protein
MLTFLNRIFSESESLPDPIPVWFKKAPPEIPGFVETHVISSSVTAWGQNSLARLDSKRNVYI